MNTSRNINSNKWIRISMIIAFALALLTLVQGSLSAEEKQDQEKEKPKAELSHNVDEWMDGEPTTFVEENKKAQAESMDKTAKETRALEARLMAQIAYLERLEGFLPKEPKQAKKEVPIVEPTNALK